VNPAAMRSYFRAGFRLLPTVSLGGIVRREAIPAGLRSRPGDPDADAATIDLASRHVRGATHRPDLPTMLATGRLLVLDGEGFAVHRDGKVALLAATSDEARRTSRGPAWPTARPAAPWRSSSSPPATTGRWTSACARGWRCPRGARVRPRRARHAPPVRAERRVPLARRASSPTRGTARAAWPSAGPAPPRGRARGRG
jgi:hypothetical protein